MILYFNDYKLIYIITMMGKINNIPVLNEDVIRLVVLNEEIIGYIYPRRTSYVVALEIKPGRTTSWNGTYIPSMKHILPSFGLGKGGYFAVRYFLASTPKK